MSFRERWAELGGLILILIGFAPLVVIHFANLWHRPHYRHVPFLLVAVALLLWKRCKRLPASVSGPKWRKTSTVLFSFALLSLATATVIFSPWTAAVGFVLAAGGVTLVLRERYDIDNSLGIWLLLCFLVSVPRFYDVHLSQLTQRLTTLASGGILERAGIPNVVEGTTLLLAGGRLLIQAACSGFVSVLAIIASCLLVAVYLNRAFLHTVLLVCSGVIWALLANVLQVVTLAVAQENFGIDLSDDWRNGALGLVLFAGTIALVLSADQFLCFVFEPISLSHELTRSSRLWNRFIEFGDPKRPPQQSERFNQTQRSYMVLGATFLLFGLAGLAMSIARLTSVEAITVSPYTERLVTGLDEEFLPKKVGDWKRVSFETSRKETLFKQESRIWTYKNGDVVATFSMDYSFPRWHDLCESYRSAGWSQNGKSTVKESGALGGDFLSAEFFKGREQEANLCFCLIQSNSVPYAAPDSLSILAGIKRRLEADGTLYQIQLWASETGQFSLFERRSTEELFQKLRSIVVGQVTSVSRERATESKVN